MCYSEFNDIIRAIGAMDADVISIETARSQMELLGAFETYAYPNEVGPGVYDIHSPRIPGEREMTDLLTLARTARAARTDLGEPRLRAQDAQMGRGPPCPRRDGRSGQRDAQHRAHQGSL